MSWFSYRHSVMASPFISIDRNCPNHDRLNSGRQRFRVPLEERLVQIRLSAHRVGVRRLGASFIEGSQVQANASKPQAMRVRD